MNPVDKFYKRKRDYEIVVQNLDREYCTHVLNTTQRNDGCTSTDVVFNQNMFQGTDKKELEEVSYTIKAYLEDHAKEITNVIINRLREKMEDAKKEVLKDFEFKGGETKSV